MMLVYAADDGRERLVVELEIIVKRDGKNMVVESVKMLPQKGATSSPSST